MHVSFISSERRGLRHKPYASDAAFRMTCMIGTTFTPVIRRIQRKCRKSCTTWYSIHVHVAAISRHPDRAHSFDVTHPCHLEMYHTCPMIVDPCDPCDVWFPCCRTLSRHRLGSHARRDHDSHAGPCRGSDAAIKRSSMDSLSDSIPVVIECSRLQL